jgi:hypothetical protein
LCGAIDEVVRPLLQLIEVPGADDAIVLETARVHGNGIALGPVVIKGAVGVASVVELVILPRRRLILAEIEHVVVMGMAAHPHGDNLDQRGAVAGAGPFRRPGERGRDFVRVGAVDGDAGNAVAGCLVGEHTGRRVVAHRR